MTQCDGCDFVLFGAQGDLARRKLLPSLYQLDKAGLLGEEANIIGAARRDYDHDKYREIVRENMEEFLKEPLCEETWQRFSKRLYFFNVDIRKSESFAELKDFLKDSTNCAVYYFALPPSIFGDMCEELKSQDLISERSRVVLEKPIGHDLSSSKEINDKVSEYFNESQVYRIDHYLGKETVMNLFALRFANAFFTTNWDHNSIDHVQITVAEEVGIEGRWGYFDQAGQMRDMVQNHLLQILTLIAMEPPVDLTADSVRMEKLKVLKALRPITADNVERNTVRGQYVDGFIKGAAVPGYLEEEGANEHSETETFVALRADIDNWRWAGVPFYLRTGKRLHNKMSEVVIYFKPQPHNVFARSYSHLQQNKLTIRLQPQEGIEVEILNKIPGLDDPMRLQQTKLDLSFSEAFDEARIVDAYERLLFEAMNGNQTLFVHRDEVEQAWQWVDGIFAAWEKSGMKPKPYAAGSWGPVASIAMITQDGRSWDE